MCLLGTKRRMRKGRVCALYIITVTSGCRYKGEKETMAFLFRVPSVCDHFLHVTIVQQVCIE